MVRTSVAAVSSKETLGTESNRDSILKRGFYGARSADAKRRMEETSGALLAWKNEACLWLLRVGAESGRVLQGAGCLNEMAHFGALRGQVFDVVGIRFGVDRNAFDDFKPVPFESDDFFGIVCQEAHFMNAEVHQNLSAHAVVPQLCGEPEAQIRFHRIQAALLQFVGVDFGGESDAASLVPAHVENHTAALGFNHLHGLLQLGATVATSGSKNIAREAFAVHAHERGVGLRDVSFDQGEVMFAIDGAPVEVQLEVAEVRGEMDDLFSLDEFFLSAAVGDEVGNAAHFELVVLLELDEFGQARHGAVCVQDFTENTGGMEAGHPGQVHGRLGVASAAEHASSAGAEGEDVAGLHEVLRFGVGVCENGDGGGAVVR